MKWEYEQDRAGDSTLLCLGTADMDFQSPKPILDALSAIIDNGHLGYPFPKSEFYEAVHRFLLSKGWDVDVRNSLQNGVGIYTSIWTAIDSLSSIGDEIIYQTPVHFCFRAMIEDNGRVGVENPLKYTNGTYTIADEIVVMYLGRIVEKAPSHELFSNTLHPYSKALFSAIPEPSIHNRRERVILQGEVTSPVNPPKACRFAGRCPYATAKCRSEEPVLTDVGNGHQVACFLHA